MASEIRVNKIENRSGLGTVTFADTGVDLAGIVTATTFSGSGASLTGLPAASLTGTVADARFPATLPAISGANLTNIPAANVTGTLPALTAANLTNIPAANLVGVCTSGLTKTGGFGKLVQVVSTTKTDTFSASLSSGAETVSGDVTGLTVSITPENASNKILLMTSVCVNDSQSNNNIIFFYKDGSVISGAIGDAANDGDGNAMRRVTFGVESSTGPMGSSFTFLDTAGGTSAITYSIRIGNLRKTANSTIYVNRDSDTDEVTTHYTGGRSISTITAMEISA